MTVDLRTEKAAAQVLYAAIARTWVRCYGIWYVLPSASLAGSAFVDCRIITAPWPATTRRELYIVAHEIGHVALGHRARQLPVYVQEFEAERFAIALMRRAGLAVPRDMTARGKRYVALKIERAFRRGARWIDPDIARWAGTYVGGINYCTPPRQRIRFAKPSLARVDRAVNPETDRC